MARPFNEGGIGLRDTGLMALVATVWHTIRLWSSNQSIWTAWLWQRYVKCRALNDITLSSSFSTIWSSIIRVRDLTAKCMTCGRNYQTNWVGRGTSRTTINIYESIRPSSNLDPLAGGIWTTKSLKMSITLWRLRWNHLHNFDRLCSWHIQCPAKCVLCDESDETLDHLFFNCGFSHELWTKFTRCTDDTL